ncbi:DNA topoisomerase IV subunit B [uncultured Maricaulis sp.]|uniref:DNA topoisomerase IV subunit B n=1 Tax=uncultured Maricaulis sp. TaxID=174710 RepID=UPI0030DC9A25|tara:strand:+ start:20318 stop:22333 length:2016 start_codon:yes stop_codon:yes gene_type:complete
MSSPSSQSDLFSASPAPIPDATPPAGYSAAQIEVLEGLEAVRRRPGMYIGGTDERAYHHLFAEVLDNSMDEAVAGWADRIEVALDEDGYITVTDNGRGIPVDPHPKFPDKSALEVVLTILHAGGKFSDKAYKTSGGLHGVGISVVNALSSVLEVEVAREKILWSQNYSRGLPLGPLVKVGATANRRGTKIRFLPDTEIFGDKMRVNPARVYAMARSKAFLRRGVKILWRCPESMVEGSDIPAETLLCFPGGLADRLTEMTGKSSLVTTEAFTGKVERSDGSGGVEWAMAWSNNGFGSEADGFCQTYCNTVPTPQGGTHEQGFRAAITKGLRAYADHANAKKAALITPDDVLGGAGALVSVFISEPEFQGQTKERLASPEAAKLVEAAVRDQFDHWLAGSPKEATKLVEWAIERAEDRLRRRKEKTVKRQSASRRLRLPGKLADCSRADADGTELFLVEGDSAGGSAKQARNRKTQAILPLRGKIINVVSSASDKVAANQEISDLQLALGCQTGSKFKLEDLRYQRIVIMTDADVDGAHIAALLITFFFTAMPELIHAGRLYLAQPPLFRLTQGSHTLYARDEIHRDQLLRDEFKGSAKIDIGRFKGLGEMTPAQLKTTTMDPGVRTLARVIIPEGGIPTVEALVETLMGKKPELRFAYIQEHAPEISTLDI